MAKDLRSFIAELEAASPEEIARVTETDLAALRNHGALLTQLEKQQTFSAAFLREHRRQRRSRRGQCASEPQADGAGLAVQTRRAGDEVHQRQGKPIAPVEVKDAPVHEVVKVGDEVDLDTKCRC